MRRGAWNTLEGLAGGHVPAAVLAEWRRLAEGDFPWLGAFLRVTQRLAGDYPCLAEPDCGCRHELVQCDDARWVSRCQCGRGGCGPAWLGPNELSIHELDAAGFGRAVARALGFGAPENAALLYAAPRMWQVGIYAPTGSAVYLGIFPSEAELLANVAGLVASRPEPFILLMPTAGLRSAAVDSFLTRVQCGFMALAPLLSGDERGSLRVTGPLEPVLKRFAADLAQGPNMGPMLEGIHRELVALREEAIKPAAAAEQPIKQGEAGRVFQLFGELLAMGTDLVAPPARVFDLMVFKKMTKAETARECKCAASLITNRVGLLERHFTMPMERLRAFASDLQERQRTVKGDRYARKEHGAVPDEPEQYEDGDKPGAGEDENGYLPEERYD